MPESPAFHYPELRDTSVHTETIAAEKRQSLDGFQPVLMSFSQICEDPEYRLTIRVTVCSHDLGRFERNRICRPLPKASKFGSWQLKGLRLHIIEHTCDLVGTKELLPLKDF